MNIPNLLTIFRILLIPVFVYFLSVEQNYVATAIFIVAAITDWLDGYWARKTNQVTDFGKLMDPIADKILVMSALVMLVGLRGFFKAEPWVPAWIVIMVLARETWVNGLRSLAASRGVVVAAGNLGKIKSFLQMTAIILLLLHDLVLVQIGRLPLTASFFGERLLVISLVFSYWSAVEYTNAILIKKK